MTNQFVKAVKVTEHLLRNYLRSCSTITRNSINLNVLSTSILREKDKIADLIRSKVDDAANSELMRKLKVARTYYTLEMSPPNFGEAKKLKADIALTRDFINQGCWKFMTVKQAWLMFLVCTEILMWFYVGEVIGKMNIVGYKV